MLPPGRAATFHLRHLLRTFQLPSPYRLLLQPAVLSSSPACSRRRAASPSVRRPPLPPPPSLPAPPLFPPPCSSPPHMLFPRQTNPRPPLHAAKGRPGGPSALLLLLISKPGAVWVRFLRSSSSGAPVVFWLSVGQCRASTLPLTTGRRSGAHECWAKTFPF